MKMAQNWQERKLRKLLAFWKQSKTKAWLMPPSLKCGRSCSLLSGKREKMQELAGLFLRGCLNMLSRFPTPLNREGTSSEIEETCFYLLLLFLSLFHGSNTLFVLFEYLILYNMAVGWEVIGRRQNSSLFSLFPETPHTFYMLPCNWCLFLILTRESSLHTQVTWHHTFSQNTLCVVGPHQDEN